MEAFDGRKDICGLSLVVAVAVALSIGAPGVKIALLTKTRNILSHDTVLLQEKPPLLLITGSMVGVVH
jgi:hypothetical protein